MRFVGPGQFRQGLGSRQPEPALTDVRRALSVWPEFETRDLQPMLLKKIVGGHYTEAQFFQSSKKLHKRLTKQRPNTRYHQTNPRSKCYPSRSSREGGDPKISRALGYADLVASRVRHCASISRTLRHLSQSRICARALSPAFASVAPIPSNK